MYLYIYMYVYIYIYIHTYIYIICIYIYIYIYNICIYIYIIIIIYLCLANQLALIVFLIIFVFLLSTIKHWHRNHWNRIVLHIQNIWRYGMMFLFSCLYAFFHTFTLYFIIVNVHGYFFLRFKNCLAICNVINLLVILQVCSGR